MRDIYQVLREKELEIIRVRQEIEALRSILPLLSDGTMSLHLRLRCMLPCAP